MKQICFSVLGLVILAAGFKAQTADPLSSDIKQAYDSVKKNLLAAADKVPESDYNFKPTPEVRSFAEVLGHAATAQLRTCGAINSTETHGSPNETSKQQLVATLKESFAACDKAYEALTDANAAEIVKLPRGQKTRLGALAGVVNHDTEQYAILSVYMRLKGVVPPSSER